MRSLFQMLMRFYPKNFRREFTQEILTTLESLQREQTNRGSIGRSLFVLREIAGLLRGAFAEQLSSIGSPKCPAIADAPPMGVEITDLERRIRFHLLQTIHCIANHKFAGARFHAAEEDRARSTLLALQTSGRRPTFAPPLNSYGF